MKIIAGFILLFFAAGCTKIGPETVTRDRFEYSNAINYSLKQQVLLNIVRLRYVDSPMVLDVSQVVTNYSLERVLTLEGELEFDASDLLILTAEGIFTESPTITYTPVVGKDMVERILEPVPPSAVLFLIQSGWRADQVLDQIVNVINGYRNRNLAQGLRHEGDKEFYRLGKLFLKLQQEGAIGLRVNDPSDGTQALTLALFNRMNDPKVQETITELQTLLGLDPKTTEYTISFGSIAPDASTIAFQTRSALQIMLQLATAVKVPEEHLGRVVVYDSTGIDATSDLPTAIYSSREKPAAYFVAVPYRGYWYWIEDTDLATKGQLWVLMLLLNISEGEESAAVPLITIPAN